MIQDIAILETILFFLRAEQLYMNEFKDSFKKLPKYIKEYQYNQNRLIEENFKKSQKDSGKVADKIAVNHQDKDKGNNEEFDCEENKNDSNEALNNEEGDEH